MHAVQTGEFVNRGVMHGPWLPIYGWGAAMTLVLLNRVRPHPFVMFFSTTALCGTLEYVTSWYLEQANGVRWWDYSGYFLNINGRICAEGLLLSLLLMISMDQVYYRKHPNLGKGITSGGDTESEETDNNVTELEVPEAPPKVPLDGFAAVNAAAKAEMSDYFVESPYFIRVSAN